MNPNPSRELIVKDLGSISYMDAWAYQEKLFGEIVSLKMENRNLEPRLQKQTPNFLLFCEHPHVFTLGRAGKENNLLVNEKFLKSKGASFVHTNRGGDITYHGPGQLVVYPVLDLENFFTDIHKYMRLLEEAVILTLKDFGIIAGRIKGKTGVWLGGEVALEQRKICAMGVRCSRWVTMHGLALNVNTDLSYFNFIVPCGLEGSRVTSFEIETGEILDLCKIQSCFLSHFRNLFNIPFVK